MRFDGVRHLPTRLERVWSGLHDTHVLRSSVPGCAELVPVEPGVFAATMSARVGPIADTYRGTFSIEDLRPGHELMVRVDGRGRCGRLEVELHVALAPAAQPGTTALTYVADATVSGLVARMGRAAMTVAGNHFTGGFFRELGHALGRPAGAEPVLV